MYRLTIEQGDPQGAVFDFTDGEIIIGRSHSARVKLAAPDVSGQHVRLTVRGGQVIVENLSRYQTAIDGTLIQAPALLAPGQRLKLGKSTVLLFEAVNATAEAEGLVEAATGGGIDVEVTGVAHGGATGSGAQPPAPSGSEMRTMGGARDAGADALSQPGSYAGGAEEGMTRAMQTRAAGQDELEFLRSMDRHRARNRVLLMAGIVLVVGIVAVLLVTRQPEVETTISWPTDEEGEMIEGREESPLGGFALIYPKTSDSKVSTIPGGIMAECALGRRGDLQMRVTLEETVDDRYVKETIEDSITRWKEQVTAENPRWNIDTPIPVNLFLGNDNGILFKILPYQRQDDESWSGLASILRHGRRFIVVRAEVPSGDRARAEEILYNRFLDPTTEFVRSHWEGSRDIPNTSTADILGRAHEELRRLAPATWDDVEEQLASALQKSVIEKNEDYEKDAMEMLVTLRNKKALWYNEQLVQKEAALAQGDAERVRRIAEFCKAVFSSLHDQRYYEVRKW
ncbi:MAG: FHA domain-containing protein [bacterium]